MCKRIITIILTIALVASLALSASAATTMKWDFSKAQQSINKTATEMVQEVENEYPSWTDYFANWFKKYYNFG